MTKIEELLSKALDYVEATEGFLKEQTPLLIQEILKYELFESGVIIVALLLVAGAMWKGGKLSYAAHLKEKDESSSGEHEPNEGGYIILSIILKGVTATLLGFTVPQLLTIIKINIAPRLFMIEYIKELL